MRPGGKGVGILLAPTTGRGIAFAIIGAPLVLFLIIGFTASSSSSGPDNGTSGGYGYPQSLSTYSQSEPVYTSSESVYPQDTPTSVPTTSDSGFGVPLSTTDETTDATSDATTTDAATDTATSTTATTTATGSPTTSATTHANPAEVVAAAYNDLNRRDYQDAYKLGLAPSGQTYQSFVAGYSTTQSDAITITGVSGNVVSVELIASKTDGAQSTYTGTYTVTDGVITGADLQQVN